jgi:hypothetical protein
MTAFEELLAWCEKHLPVGEYQVVEESRSYAQTVYFDMYNNEEHPFMCFGAQGGFISAGVLTDEDRCEHIRDLEATERERGAISCEK